MKDSELEQKLHAYFEKEANGFKMPAERELKALAPKNKRKHVSMRRYLTAAACFLLAVCIAAVPLLHGRDIAGSSSHGDSNAHEQPSKDTESVGIVRPSGTAPWEDGRLQLTSVTYKEEALAQAKATAASWQFASQKSNTAKNVSISMLANTKISGCVNANLLLITPTEGEHVGCDGVYYDIRKDRVFCLACHIKDEIREDPYYIDICIRSLIEEYLITNEDIFAGAIDYKPMYASLDNDIAKECFSGGSVPTCESLAFDYARGDMSTYDALMAGYQYPIIRVIEYGENEDRCLFTIGSPLSDSTWGAYVFELDTGKVIKLDGETVGLHHPINGYMGGTPEEYLAVNLPNATGVSVTENYDKIIVTLPYFMDGYYTDDTGRLTPIYTGQNVIVFDAVNGTYSGLLGNSPYSDTDSLDLPTAHAKSYGEIIYYPTDGNAWCLYSGDVCYTLQGELLRLSERDGGGYLAVMKSGVTFEIYSLEGEQAVLVENEAIYVLDGNSRVLVSNGSTEKLWEDEPAAAVSSADGRFVYLYFKGDGFITCLDIDSGERGQLTLSEDFVSQVTSLARTEFLLFLNPSETRLLIAYYKDGALIFDSEGFLANEALWKDFEATQICNAFEHNFKKTLAYFYNGETNVSFKDRDAVVSAAKVLGMEGLYELACKDDFNNMSSLIVEVAMRIAEIADYAGNTAEISGLTVNTLLDGMTFDAFDELYTELYGHFVEIRYTDSLISSFYGDDNIQVLAEDIASGILTHVYGYVPPAENDLAYFKEHLPKEYEIYLELYKRLNEEVDQDKMAVLQTKLAAYLVPVLTDAGIDPEYPTYTGYMLNSLLEEHLDELVSIALDGGEYVDFIRSCGFAHPYDDGYYSGRTDKRLDSMLMSEKYAVNTDKLTDWMNGIEFVAGTVDIDREAGVYMEWEMNLFYASYYMYPGTEIVAVGHGTDGKAYAVISGYYAEISEEQFYAFYTLCGEGTLYNRDAGVIELLEQIRAEQN